MTFEPKGTAVTAEQIVTVWEQIVESVVSQVSKGLNEVEDCFNGIVLSIVKFKAQIIYEAIEIVTSAMMYVYYIIRHGLSYLGVPFEQPIDSVDQVSFRKDFLYLCVFFTAWNVLI